VNIPNVGWAFPTFSDNPNSPSGIGINWSFSFPTIWAGHDIGNYEMAGSLGLPLSLDATNFPNPANNTAAGSSPNSPCPSGSGRTKRMLVTGYDNSFQSTGKNPGDPGYGLTANGSVTAPGTIAAPRIYPFGTQMYIPGYGLGTVLDRGGAIRGSHIDLWFPTTQQAMNWGAQHLQVTVCK
jgi:3D (Asp-Asp-Asp) domain-containing protein